MQWLWLGKGAYVPDAELVIFWGRGQVSGRGGNVVHSWEGGAGRLALVINQRNDDDDDSSKLHPVVLLSHCRCFIRLD